MRRSLALAVCALGLLASSSAHARLKASKTGWRQGRLELGPRISHLLLEDAETGQTLPMGGAGFFMRYRLTRRFGIEGAWDLNFSDELGDEGRDGEVFRVTAPLTGSALFYLFPDSRFQMYLLAGFGVAAHAVEYEAYGESANFATPVVQFGLGGQYRARKARFDFSLRALTMKRSADDIEFEPLDDVSGVRPVDYSPLVSDRTVHGAMMSFGVSWGL